MSAHGGGVPFGDAARDATASYYVGRHVRGSMTADELAEAARARHRPEPLDDEARWEPEHVPPCEDYDADHQVGPGDV